MEGVLLAGFGNVGHKQPTDVCRDEVVMVEKVCVGMQLLLYPLVGGELAQALGNLTCGT